MASAADGRRKLQFRRGGHCEGGAAPFRALGGDSGANRGSILSAARMGRTPADDDAYRDALYRSNHQAWREAWRRDGLRWGDCHKELFATALSRSTKMKAAYEARLKKRKAARAAV